MKKINKGLILTIIVVLALTIYLINLEKQRDTEKVNILGACEQFVELTNKYNVLPENTEKTIEEYALEMKQELENQMISNKEDIELQHKFYKNKLEKGYNETKSRTKYNREIIKITDYEFEKNQVTVIFNSEVEETIKIGNEEQQNVFEVYGDEIILQKVDENWKVVYSNLQDRVNMYGDYYFEESITLY